MHQHGGAGVLETARGLVGWVDLSKGGQFAHLSRALHVGACAWLATSDPYLKPRERASSHASRIRGRSFDVRPMLDGTEQSSLTRQGVLTGLSAVRTEGHAPSPRDRTRTDRRPADSRRPSTGRAPLGWGTERGREPPARACTCRHPCRLRRTPAQGCPLCRVVGRRRPPPLATTTSHCFVLREGGPSARERFGRRGVGHLPPAAVAATRSRRRARPGWRMRGGVCPDNPGGGPPEQVVLARSGGPHVASAWHFPRSTRSACEARVWRCVTQAH